MSDSIIAPENPTLIERFIIFLRLPYPIGCLVAALLITSSGVLILESGSPEIPEDIFTSALLLAYVLYVPRYMRGKVVGAEQSLVALLPGGEPELHKLFGRVSAFKPQVALWLFLGVPFITSAFLTFNIRTFLLALLLILGGSVSALGISSLVCTYFYSLLGIHKLGGASLRFRPYYEDSALGLRPAGSLALSLVAAYFGLCGLLGLLSLLPITATFYIIVFPLISGLILLGLLMFFLPLRRLHQAMTKQKMIEKRKISDELALIHQNPPVAKESSDVAYVFRLDMMKREITAIATWPFDVQILGRLTIIVLSVIATLLARVIINALRI